FQFVILNLIDDAHLNSHSLQLKEVLNRKFEIGTYPYKKFDFKSGWVRVAISNKNLTLRNWEQILQSKKIRKRGEHNRWNSDFIENTLESFSSIFAEEVAKKPIEFTLFVLNLNKPIDDAYIDALYSGISRSDKINEIPSKIIAKLIDKFPPNNDSYRANDICHIISKHNETNWSINVIHTIKEIAINHHNPEPGQFVVTSIEDEEMKSARMLLSNAINCVRGNAAQALGSLLWSDKTLFNDCQPAII